MSPPKHHTLDAHAITNQLYVGSAPPDGLVLAGHGFNALVLAALEYQPKGVNFPGVWTIHAPINDVLGVSPEDASIIEQAAVHIARLLRSGRKVISTCQMGRNRSALLAARALMINGMRADSAIALVRSRRTDRMGVPALENESFRAYLRGQDDAARTGRRIYVRAG